MREKRKRNGFSASTAHLLLCSTFFCAGLLIGLLCDKLVSAQARDQLSNYLQAYVTSASSQSTDGSFFAVLLGYLRYPVITFAVGAFGGGMFLLPLLFTMQGFSLSFAVQCFVGSFGQQGTLISLCLLGIRCFFVLPCTLYLAGAAIRKATERRSYISNDYFMFCVCLGILLLGTLLDLAIVPKLLHRVLL